MDEDEIIGMEVFFPQIANDDRPPEIAPYYCDWAMARRKWSEMKQAKKQSSFEEEYNRTRA